MRKKFLILIGLLLVISAFLGTSFAIWKFSEIQENPNTLASNCFNLSIINESKEITLENAYPISDEEGLAGGGVFLYY